MANKRTKKNIASRAIETATSSKKLPSKSSGKHPKKDTEMYRRGKAHDAMWGHTPNSAVRYKGNSDENPNSYYSPYLAGNYSFSNKYGSKVEKTNYQKNKTMKRVKKQMGGKMPKRPVSSGMIEPSKEVTFDSAKKYANGGDAKLAKMMEGSFGDARKRARAAGKDTFTWKGKSYGSRGSQESKEQHSSNMENNRKRAAADNSNRYYARLADERAEHDKKVANTPQRMASRQVGPVNSNAPKASLQTSRVTVPAASSEGKKKSTRSNDRANVRSMRQETRQGNRAIGKADRAATKGDREGMKESRAQRRTGKEINRQERKDYKTEARSEAKVGREVRSAERKAGRQAKKDEKARKAIRGAVASKERYMNK